MGDLFSGCNVASDSKETQLGSRNQEASPSAGKNTRIVLVPCWAWKCIPAAISDGEDISKVPGCHLLWQMSSQWDSKKLLQRLVSHELTAYLSVFNLLLTQWIMVILSKGYKPDNFEPQNSLKLSFTNFEVFALILLNMNLSLNQILLRFLLYVRQNLVDSIDSGNFSVRDDFSLICKKSITYMHGLAV